MKPPIRVVVPSVYDAICPTIRSRLYPFCRELLGKGFRFTFLVVGEDTKETEPGLVCEGYKSYQQLISRVVKLKKADVDIVFACKPHSITGLLSLIISKVRDIGFVLDVDDRITVPSRAGGIFRRLIYLQELIAERILMLLKPPTVVASKELERYWGRHVNYIPNTADLNFFSKARWSPLKVRETLKHNDFLVLWPAVFFHEIDREYIIDVFEHIQRKQGKICLMALGSGDYLPVIEAETKRRGLKNIIFHDAVDYKEMPYYYAAADAGVIPLRDRHFDACKGPIKLYEYMAMELPVIATPIGEPYEMIRAADCGVTIPFNDPEKAADVIMELSESRESARRLGMNGRLFLEKFQSLGAQADKLEKVLLSAMPDRGKEKTCQL